MKKLILLISVIIIMAVSVACLTGCDGNKCNACHGTGYYNAAFCPMCDGTGHSDFTYSDIPVY